MKFKLQNLQLSLICLLASSFLLLSTYFAEADLLSERFIFKRQSIEQPKEGNNNNNNNNAAQNSPPARLYPDLVVQPIDSGGFGANLAPNQSPTPFIPFNSLQGGINSMPPPGLVLNNRLQQAPMMNRPMMTGAERQQSQTFVNGLGKRLLSMIGINTENNANEGGENKESTQDNNNPNRMDETMKALQNSTVLNQLNKSLNSIYGSLSRMYNSTVQEQINLLQERFKRETENSTNPWQQRMAQQVPQFFQQMAMKVGEAQENLNRVWRQVTQNMGPQNGTTMDNNNNNNNNPAAKPRGFFDQFMSGVGGDEHFFNQFPRSYGNADPFQQAPAGGQQPAQMDFAGQLRYFWHNQVQPQIGMIRRQMSTVWRDLTSSGALTMRSINDQFLQRPKGQNSSQQQPNSDLVDEILKDVDLNSPEYTLIDTNSNKEDQASSSSSKSEQQQQQQNGTTTQQMLTNPSQQMIQNGLMNAQRELNQLWNGLTNSLQGTIGRVRTMVNPPQRQVMFNPFAPSQPQPIDRRDSSEAAPDPAENEIDGKLKDLTKLQKEADTVYEVVRQQQQQQQQQATFGDRFRNFFNQFDQFGNQVEQFPAKFGDSMSRFGTAVGDLWNQIPTRWNNFMNGNNRPQPPMMTSERLTSIKPKQQAQNNGASSTTTTAPANS